MQTIIGNINQLCPIGGVLAQILSRDKGFRDFQKVEFSITFLKIQFWFVNNNIKWRDRQVDPFGHCLCSSPSGDKGFCDFQKVGRSNLFLKTQIWFVNHALGSGLAVALPIWRRSGWQPLDLKIRPKVGLRRSKTIFKPCLNKYKQTL